MMMRNPCPCLVQRLATAFTVNILGIEPPAAWRPCGVRIGASGSAGHGLQLRFSTQGIILSRLECSGLACPSGSKLRAGAAESWPPGKPRAMPSHKVNLVTAYRITPLPKRSRPVDC